MEVTIRAKFLTFEPDAFPGGADSYLIINLGQ